VILNTRKNKNNKIKCREKKYFISLNNLGNKIIIMMVFHLKIDSKDFNKSSQKWNLLEVMQDNLNKNLHNNFHNNLNNYRMINL
jgi:hypothetical protein